MKKNKKEDRWINIVLDDPKTWPKKNRVKLEKPNVDSRGTIQSLLNYPVKNVSIITSKKNSVRSNHYHKKDWHFMYIIKGAIEYYYRDVGDKKKPKKTIIKEGEMVWTPPWEEHATVFLKDTTLIAMSRNIRDQKTYEEDTIRVKLV